MSIQTKSITKELYKLPTFELYKIVDRLEKEFPLLNTVVEQEENLDLRRELLLITKQG